MNKSLSQKFACGSKRMEVTNDFCYYMTNKKMTDISIQIVNYNTKKYLKKCLESLLVDLKDADFSWSINILDNNSDDDLTDLEECYASRNLPTNFYKSDKNLGFSAGHNLLSKKGDSKYILILNPDVEIIEKNTLRRLLIQMRSDKGTKVVGPKLIGRKGKTQRFDHGELKGVWAKFKMSFGDGYWKERAIPAEVAWVSGACLFVEREVFEKIGGFDENFFLYKEEEDFCLRIRELGYSILYFPQVKIFHVGSVVAKKDEHMTKSLKYFVSKHIGKNLPVLLYVKFWETVFFCQWFVRKRIFKQKSK